MFLRFMLVWGVILLILSVATGCNRTTGDEHFKEDWLVTENDPRDIAQCKAQPDLGWCRAACRKSNNMRSWCDARTDD